MNSPWRGIQRRQGKNLAEAKPLAGPQVAPGRHASSLAVAVVGILPVGSSRQGDVLQGVDDAIARESGATSRGAANDGGRIIGDVEDWREDLVERIGVSAVEGGVSGDESRSGA